MNRLLLPLLSVSTVAYLLLVGWRFVAALGVFAVVVVAGAAVADEFDRWRKGMQP